MEFEEMGQTMDEARLFLGEANICGDEENLQYFGWKIAYFWDFFHSFIFFILAEHFLEYSKKKKMMWKNGKRREEMNAAGGEGHFYFGISF